MKHLVKTLALLVAFVCIGIAGWQFHSFIYGKADRRSRVPHSPPAPPRPKLPPMVKPPQVVLLNLPKATLTEMTDADWRKAYPAAFAADRAVERVVPVALPWRFGSTEQDLKKESPLAQMVPFFLSADLAWARAVYNVPPAFVIFGTAGDQESGISAEYEPAAIAARIKGWNGTHATGGVLVRDKDGYVATLQIFDANGKLVHETPFEKPRPFFELVGDVSADAITFFGTPCGATLHKHLRRERCGQTQSLIEVGRTAFLPPDSPAGLTVIKAVLEKDSRFGELRHWRMQRLARQMGGIIDSDGEIQRALVADVDMGTVADLCQTQSPTEVASADTSAWIDFVERIAGQDHPEVAAMRIKQAFGSVRGAKGALDIHRLQAAGDLVRKYPHHGRLLNAILAGQVNYSEQESTGCPYDPELAASAALVALLRDSNGQNPLRADYWQVVARSAEALGRWDHVLAACRRLRKEGLDDDDTSFLEAAALTQLGEYGRACDLYERLFKNRGRGGWDWRALESAVVSAILADRQELLDDMSLDAKFSVPRVNTLMSAGRQFMAGQRLDSPQLDVRRDYVGTDLFLAECELGQGGDFARPDRQCVWLDLMRNETPADRLRWALLDRYLRAQPGLEFSQGFYEASEWEHPDDPLVRQAVEAWRKAGAGQALPSVQQVLEQLRTRYTPQLQLAPPSWIAIARIRRETEEGRFDSAWMLIDAFAKREPQADEIRTAWVSRKVRAAEAASRPGGGTP